MIYEFGENLLNEDVLYNDYEHDETNLEMDANDMVYDMTLNENIEQISDDSWWPKYNFWGIWWE